MLALRDLRVGRQEIVEVPAPPRRIVARSEAGSARIVEDGFNTLSDPTRGLRYLRPTLFEEGEDVGGVDTVRRLVADGRVGVSLQCRGPLVRVLRALPARLVRSDVKLRYLFEGDGGA